MDYKQKYEQSLERARSFSQRWQGIEATDSELALQELKEIFPELKESEDEKIRKEIIQSIQENMCVIHKDKCIAWLEKQGKVKHTCRNCQTFQDLHQNCPHSPIYQYTNLTEAHKHLDDETNCEFWLEKQGEQKPADKKYTFNALPRLLDMIQPTDRAKAYCQKLIDILIQEGYNVDAKIVGTCLKRMNGEKVAMTTMDEQKPTDKVEPKFKVGEWITIKE